MNDGSPGDSFLVNNGDGTKGIYSEEDCKKSSNNSSPRNENCEGNQSVGDGDLDSSSIDKVQNTLPAVNEVSTDNPCARNENQLLSPIDGTVTETHAREEQHTDCWGGLFSNVLEGLGARLMEGVRVRERSSSLGASVSFAAPNPVSNVNSVAADSGDQLIRISSGRQQETLIRNERSSSIWRSFRAFVGGAEGRAKVRSKRRRESRRYQELAEQTTNPPAEAVEAASPPNITRSNPLRSFITNPGRILDRSISTNSIFQPNYNVTNINPTITKSNRKPEDSPAPLNLSKNPPDQQGVECVEVPSNERVNSSIRNKNSEAAGTSKLEIPERKGKTNASISLQGRDPPLKIIKSSSDQPNVPLTRSNKISPSQKCDIKDGGDTNPRTPEGRYKNENCDHNQSLEDLTLDPLNLNNESSGQQDENFLETPLNGSVNISPKRKFSSQDDTKSKRRPPKFKMDD